MSAREGDGTTENGEASHQEAQDSGGGGDGEEGSSTGPNTTSENQPKTENPSNQRNSESSTTAEATDDRVRFTSRRRARSYAGRQYRRRASEMDESSGEEHVTRDARGSSSESPFSREQFLLSSSSSVSSQSSHSLENNCVTRLLDDDEPLPKALLKPKPRHKWFAVKEIIGREAGCGGRWQGNERFQHRYYGSLHAVQRLELMYKLENHDGCVNSLHFNRTGELLLSASDDKKVVLWDWAVGRSILSYNSGHTSNVLQVKFLPLSGDRHIVTCARDGQVRLGVLSGVGVCKDTRLLAQHRRSTHKLAIHPDTPHVFLSAGGDALVLSHDVRINKATRLLYVKEGSVKMGLFSIHCNPVSSNEFIVTGEDQYIRLYDRRKVRENVTLNKFCPKHLLKPDAYLYVTCAVFNYNGSEIVGSYNDDDIYLFDTRLPPLADYVHKYEGHRNSNTIKGVNFFGPHSEFIVSGSDCGNIFFWDRSTEAIVQWMRGDEEGVVNCLEPHPQVPIIATSGLDSDVKIWVPSCEQEPTMKGLKSTILNNQCDRDHAKGRRSDPSDNWQMRWLWREIQRFEQSRGGGPSASRGTAEPPSTPPTGTFSGSSSSSDEEPAQPQCSTS